MMSLCRDEANGFVTKRKKKRKQKEKEKKREIEKENKYLAVITSNEER